MENLQSKVTVSRGSDISYQSEVEISSVLDDTANKENAEEIIYYPPDEDEVAR